MYIPNLNRMNDRDEAVNFMQRFSFATLVTATGNMPQGTHLPFLVSSDADTVTLTSHMAKANPQWKSLEGNPALVIFTGPHAYISPHYYEKELNVPTWNYLAVHAYGNTTLITEPAEVLVLLESMIDSYEKEYRVQWNGLPDDYKLGMINGIVAFRITVTDLQAKKKLSQNKTETEQENIIKGLSKSTDPQAKAIGDYMRGSGFKV